MSTAFIRSMMGVCTFALATAVSAGTMGSKSEHEATVERAEANYEVAKAKCDQLNGNPKDICLAQAKSDKEAVVAAADVAYEPSVEKVVDSRIAKADGAYDVAKQQCDARTGNDKDVCMKEAEAVHTKAVENAKADLEIAEVRTDAVEKARDADYDTAMERCDSFDGASEDACVAEAKARFGK